MRIKRDPMNSAKAIRDNEIRTPSRGVRKLCSRGFTLTEVVIASAIMVVVLLAIGATMRVAQMSLVSSRQHMRASRLARTIQTQLQSMNFFDIVSCDSSRDAYGLRSTGVGGLHAADYPFSNYPSSRTLLNIQQQVREAGFHHFDFRVSFIRRDRSAVRAVGVTSNVIPFTDTVVTMAPPASLAAYTAGDGIDDYDINVRYRDFNSDGDYYDTFFRVSTNTLQAVVPAGCTLMANGPPMWMYFCETSNAIAGGLLPITRQRITEMPDTRLKQVDIRLWNAKGVVHKEGWLISEAGFVGNETDDWESALTLAVSQPVFPTTLFAATTVGQNNSRAIVLHKAYPASLPMMRADGVQPLVIAGDTNDLADVAFTTSPTWSAFAPMDGQAGIAPPGAFSFPAPNITAVLVEGKNRIGGIAFKGSFLSPLWYDDFIYDIRPPQFSNPGPFFPAVLMVKTLTPFVGAQFLDNTVSTDNVSGIATDVLWVGTGTNAANAQANATSYVYGSDWPTYAGGWLVVASTVSGLIDPLPDDSWVFVHMEGGDKAGYKAKIPTLGAWTFLVRPDNVDGSGPTIRRPSAPLVAGCDVALGPPSVISCRMNDPDSGVDWRTIDFKLYNSFINPANVVAKVNTVDTPRMADYFNPRPLLTGGILTYTANSLISGNTYWVELQVQNHRGTLTTLPPFNFVAP